jgi:hypothetical protein
MKMSLVNIFLVVKLNGEISDIFLHREGYAKGI